MVWRVWFRRLKADGTVVYSGVYSTCLLPSGEKALKIIFPLPQGSATVVLRPTVDTKGNLLLESRGERFGDPGFVFLVRDRKGQDWRHYLRSFHELIHVFVDEEGVLRADHSMSLSNRLAYQLHYKMVRKAS